jgi:hypothetical protein
MIGLFNKKNNESNNNKAIAVAPPAVERLVEEYGKIDDVG